MQNLVYSNTLIEQSNEVQLNLERIFSTTKEAETSQRGYLLTRDTSFLNPYYSTDARIDSLINLVKKSIESNQKQQLNLNTLGYLIKHRLDRTDYTLQNIDSITAIPGLLEERLSTGKRVMENIRHQIDVMLEEEVRLLNEGKKIQSEYLNLTPKSLLYLTLFSLAIVFAAYYRLNHQLKIRNHFADELARKNKELNAKNQELEKTNEELQSFNYVASHDLREPVRKIKTFVSRIEKDDCSGDDLKRYIERISAITSHMQLLLDDLFSYSKTSMEERKMEEIDLNKVLEDVKAGMQEVIEETNAVIKVQHLPVVQGTAFQLRQLFENLLYNSIKYKREQIPPVVEITSTRIAKEQLPQKTFSEYESYIKISVKDNGKGFDQQYADKIFNLFQRLHSRKDLAGTGIGLAICRKVVQNHGGIITAESKLNEGAIFHIYLPDHPEASTPNETIETNAAV